MARKEDKIVLTPFSFTWKKYGWWIFGGSRPEVKSLKKK